MNPALMALRMLRRDWRSGELTVLAVAVMIAVASMTSVAFFTDRINQALQRQANELLGGDVVISADHPLPGVYQRQARELGLHSAEVREFHSMVVAGSGQQLTDIKAVTPGYPLRGTLRLQSRRFAADRPAQGIPAPGEVWVDPRLLGQLDLEAGAPVGVGEVELSIAAIIAHEPDRAGSLFNIAPRLIMNMADLPATGLIIPGSRVRYRLLVAGDDGAVQEFRDFVAPRLDRGERIEGVEDGRPEIRSALQRAERFLGLAALVSVMIAGVAIATAARRFITRHLDSCAIMRCLGARQNKILLVYLYQLLWLGVAASALGCLIGYIAQAALTDILASMARTTLPAPSWLPVASGLLVGLITLAAFALPPLLHLKHVPTLRVLRRELGALPGQSLAGYGSGLVALMVLMLWQAGDLKLGGYVLGGVIGTLAALIGLIYLLIALLRRLQQQGAVVWRFGIGNITHRVRGSLVQVLAFGLGIMVLLLLTFVRSDLLNEWQDTIPADAPNRFIINIQPDQVAGIKAFFSAEPQLSAARLFPMVRGRMTAVNGRQVDPGEYEDDRARRLATREFNLSWANELQADNTIVAGRWWGADDRGSRMLSVEEGLAETLGIEMGDTITFTVAGQSFTAEVASLRKVEWDSFNVNFFVILPPGVIDDYPTTYITSFYLPAGAHQVLNRLVRAFPNITVLDVAAILDQVRNMIERVSLAVEYVFGFTLIAGLVVLYAAIQATLDERIRENAILRTLGARRRQIVRTLLTEFAGLGALAGVVAATAASVIGYVLAEHIFHFDYDLNPWLWVTGIAGAALVIGAAGYLGTRFILQRPPLATLREL